MGIAIAIAACFVVIAGLVVIILKSVLAPKKADGVRRLLKQKNYLQAVKLAKAVIARNPKDFIAHYYLGKAYCGSQQFQQALSEYDVVNDNALFEPPLNEVQFRNEFAQLLVRLGKKAEAVKERLLLTQLDGGTPENYFELGKLEEEIGKKEDAMKHMMLVEKMNPRNAKVHAMLGNIYFSLKKTKDAKYELNEAIKLNPNEYSCYYYFGKLLKEEKNIGEAVKAFDKAQRDSEYRQKALIERGTCYIAAGRLDSAQIDLQRAIECDKDGYKSDTLYARYFLAACYEKDHNIDKAIEQWKIIVARNKGFKDVAAKLEEYQGLAANDNMKDFLTCTDAEFIEQCKKKCLPALKLDCQQAKAAKDGCIIIAKDAGEEDWRVGKKAINYVRFFRSIDPVEEDQVRDVLDAAKTGNCNKSIILSTADFSRPAIKAAEGRPVELMGKEKIEALLG